MENENEKIDIDPIRVFNKLLIITIEEMVENRAYLVTVVDELARRNSINNGTTFEVEKAILDKKYELNRNGGHARFAAKIKESLPELSSIADEHLNDLLGPHT